MAYRSNWPQTKRTKIENQIAESLEAVSYELRLGISRLEEANRAFDHETTLNVYGLPSTIAQLTETALDINLSIKNLDEVLVKIDERTPKNNFFTSLRNFFKRDLDSHDSFETNALQKLSSISELRDELISKFQRIAQDINKWGIENPEVDTSYVDQHKFGGDLQDGRADFARKIFAESGWQAKKLLTDKLPRLIDSTQLESSIAAIEMFDQSVNTVGLTSIDLQDSAPVSPEFTDDFEEISAEHALASFTELDLPYDPEENSKHNPDEFEFISSEADIYSDFPETEVLISTGIQPMDYQNSTAGFFDLNISQTDAKPIKSATVQDSSRPSLIKKWVLGAAATSVAVVGSGAVIFGGDSGVEPRSIGQDEEELTVTATIPTHPLSARDSKGSDRNQSSKVDTVVSLPAETTIPAPVALEPEIGTSAVQNKPEKSAAQKRKATVRTRSKAARLNAQKRASRSEAPAPNVPIQISDTTLPVAASTTPPTSITTTSLSTTTSTIPPNSSTTTSTVPASTTSTTSTPSTIPTETTSTSVPSTTSTVVEPDISDVANVPIRATSAPAGLEPIEIVLSR